MGGGGSTEKYPYTFSNINNNNNDNNDHNDHNKCILNNNKNEWIGETLKIISSTTLNDFELIRIIGTGILGRVRLVKHKKTNKYYAIKSIRKNEVIKKKLVNYLQEEKNVLNLISNVHLITVHPFIIRYFGFFQNDLKKIHFVMEYIPGGELFNLLNKRNKLTNDAVKFYATELLILIEYLHIKKNIIYRDFKPENIIINYDGHIKLVDFGFAKKLEQTNQRCFTIVGTPQYLAPEQLKKNDKIGYTKIIDLWSFACVVYELIVGHSPFAKHPKDSHYEVYTRIIQGKISWPSYMNKSVKDLLKKMLQLNITNRLTDINEIKNHEWFDLVDWDQVYKKRINPPFIPDIINEGDYSYFENFPDSKDETIAISNKENIEFIDF